MPSYAMDLPNVNVEGVESAGTHHFTAGVQRQTRELRVGGDVWGVGVWGIGVWDGMGYGVWGVG